MSPHEFIRKWRPVALTERQAAQEHFIDLCRLVGHPTPIEADPTGESFCFEKGALKSSGNPGFADVWKRGFFAFEYKKKKRNLGEALKQLSQYAWNLENPPLNVVCDTNAIRIVTVWTNNPSRTFDLTLDDLADPEKFAILHAVFHDPEKLKEHRTREMLTREAADTFSGLAQRFQSRGHSPESVAHFIMQLVFCFFAEDVKLLPEGFFRKAIFELNQRVRWEKAKAMLDDIFQAMATGERVGNEFLAHFNGGLFDGQAALPFQPGDLDLLVAAGRMRWAEIDPSIFGTLFERFLDPAKRAQIGAHYTDAPMIMRIIEPVILRPLLAEWEALKPGIVALAEAAKAAGPKAREWTEAESLRARYVERLATLRILDPACGSGNFLYMALGAVKDLEFRVNNECEALGMKTPGPTVGPRILFGIEINRLAAEIARTAIWIGDIQWSLRHALYTRPEPVLEKLDQIECRDAILIQRADGTWAEADWPEAEFIVGNPPFLGGKVMRQGRRSKRGETQGLGDEYVDALFSVYTDRVPAEADFVCYWFAKGWRAFDKVNLTRIGFVATNSIRGGANREVLDPFSESQAIFEAWSDEQWVVEGASVRVSLICLGLSLTKRVDAVAVDRVGADLSGSTTDLTRTARLRSNAAVAFMGHTKGGTFDVDGALARSWLTAPRNPNGRPDSDVIKPWRNGFDLSRRSRDKWIIEFGAEFSEQRAALYERPFKSLSDNVKDIRGANRRKVYRENWWRHAEARPQFHASLKVLALTRYIATPRVAKHRIFVWLETTIVPDCQIICMTRDDDTTFGILHSHFHQCWALRLGSSLEDRPRYTPTTTFETFPFPEGLTPNIPAAAYAADPRAIRIAKAAKRLDDLRNAWLNPVDLVRIEPEVVPGYPDRILPIDADAAAILAKRTLTTLYNQRPQWLADAHDVLDRAVAAAYGWPETIDIEEAMARLLALNLERAAAQDAG